MKRCPDPDCDVTVVVRTCDDEEKIGHVVKRFATHLRALGSSFEILVADEGSGDNTLAVVALLKPTLPELAALHAAPSEGLREACERARGRAVILCDAREDRAPLSALGYALERLRAGLDVVAVSGRYLVLRRTRAWRAFDALDAARDPHKVERKLLRRARQLGLHCEVTNAPRLGLADWGRRLRAQLTFARG